MLGSYHVLARSIVRKWCGSMLGDAAWQCLVEGILFGYFGYIHGWRGFAPPRRVRPSLSWDCGARTSKSTRSRDTTRPVPLRARVIHKNLLVTRDHAALIAAVRPTTASTAPTSAPWGTWVGRPQVGSPSPPITRDVHHRGIRRQPESLHHRKDSRECVDRGLARCLQRDPRSREPETPENPLYGGFSYAAIGATVSAIVLAAAEDMGLTVLTCHQEQKERSRSLSAVQILGTIMVQKIDRWIDVQSPIKPFLVGKGERWWFPWIKAIAEHLVATRGTWQCAAALPMNHTE